MVIPAFMDDLCRSRFWDANLTWNVDNPDFTVCFENTVLVWIPCAFLWILLPLEIYYLRHSKAFNIPFNIYNVFKLSLIAGIAALALTNVVHGVFFEDSPVPVYIYSSLLQFVTFILFFCLTYANIKFGIRSASILFLFSFLLVVCGAPRYRTELKSEQREETLEFVTYIIHFPFVVSVFLLNCIADSRPTVLTRLVPKDVCPENQSSFLSKLLFLWFDSLAWKGYTKPLENEDLWTLDYSNTSASVVPKFEKYWLDALAKTRRSSYVRVARRKSEAKHRNNIDEFSHVKYQRDESKPVTSILLPLCYTFGGKFLLGSILKISQDLLTFASPQILSLLIDFVGGSEPAWHGYFYAFLLFIVAFIQTLLLSQHFHQMYIIGMQIRSALTSVIYKKALCISNKARRDFTVGEIVNLMAVDTQRFSEIMAFINTLWSAPLQIVLGLFFLWQILGPSVLAGLVVIIIMIPVNGLIASRMKMLQIKLMKNQDGRIKLMNEILSGIKVLKLYAWEPSFEQRIVQIRNEEIKVLKQQAYLQAASGFSWACAPFLVSLVTFAVYVLSSDENILDAKTAFVSLSLFNLVTFPLNALSMFISNLIQTSVSIKRINKFLNSEDLNPNAVSHDYNTEPLVIQNGTFSWEGADGSPILKNINVSVKSGNLVAVVGPVGSGKSSLLSAFLGELYKLSGNVNTKGSIAYVPQQAWIQNATFKDNVTLGGAVKESFYRRVLDACALGPDMEILPAGDATEIGEKGINLSGGQKQRISLARAVCFGADIYFLDDTLSAVDSHVGKHIFEHVIGPKGLLKAKTRMLVTHSVTYLSEVDYIIVLKEGIISESGTFNELMAKKGDFADFLLTYLKENPKNEDDVHKLKELLGKEIVLEETIRQRSENSESDSASSYYRQRSTSDTDDPGKLKSLNDDVGQKLIETERAETGNVKWQVYVYYLASVGAALSIATVIMNIAHQGFSVGSSMWLSRWSSDTDTVVNGTQDIGKRNQYLVVYAALGLGQAFCLLPSSLLQTYGMIAASKYVHSFMLTRTMRAPLKFFDATPAGRIVNRFGKDINTLDTTLPQIIRSWLSCLFQVLSTLFIICYSTPIFFVVILPVGIIYYFVQRFYVATSRQLKRLESISRSPIYSHFGETVAGAQSIRAFGLQEKFIKQSEEKVDFNQKSYYPSIVSNRWLSVRLETVGNIIIFFAALFAVLQRGTLSAGLVGLSVSYALQITQTLNWLVRLTSEVETNIVTVERTKEYAEIPQEAARELSNEKISPVWPNKGQISFQDVEVRYREGLEPALKGLTFSANGGEKVGIVGRTGAGKSSLTLGVFRIIEIAKGKITIDDVDISTLGLHTLRSRITIIPQDPVLFSGTLRMNLDPAGKYSDENIWHALELAHLKTYISSLNRGLQYEVTEGGENFSVGQKQLICLSRALLRKTKVLILDEATAAIDLETDDLIQTTIRNEFKDCTVLTIAHRLNTIMDYDRIIVLDKGLMVEFDSPSALMKSKNSIFHQMATDAGLT